MPGNLLGGEQSGHIAGVGFDLYLRLVGEAVANYRGEKEEREVETKSDLPVNARYSRTPTLILSVCDCRHTVRLLPPIPKRRSRGSRGAGRPSQRAAGGGENLARRGDGAYARPCRRYS